MSTFLVYRPRRLRRTEVLRRMVRETKLSVDDFIYLLFVVHGQGVKEEISSLTGSYHWSIDIAPCRGGGDFHPSFYGPFRDAAQSPPKFGDRYHAKEVAHWLRK